jgi:hypothetical protein
LNSDLGMLVDWLEFYAQKMLEKPN